MKERLISTSRSRLALLAMLFASTVCVAMVVVRALYVGELNFLGFVWNLFLAWIPLLLSQRIYTVYARRLPHFGTLALVALAWFFFFPNAPYIITDLVHLKSRPPIPRWYDLILMMSFAWTGLFLGYLSLYQMQEVMRAWRGRRMCWWFVCAMLALSSFGIYLGRFLRWNSWDVIVQPLGLARDVIHRFDLHTDPQMAAFSLMFFGFLLISYLSLYALTHLHGWVPRAPTPIPAEEASRPGSPS